MNDDPIQTIISDERQRFLLDLEFVQSLANPQYLNFLAQRNYLKNPAFVNYLKYLLYFKREEYIKHIRYPQALNFLDLLQREEFRQELANSSYCRYIEDQQLLAWQRLQRRKINLLTNPPGLTTSSTGAAATAAANSVNNANTPSNESDAMNLSNNNGALSSSTNNGQIR